MRRVQLKFSYTKRMLYQNRINHRGSKVRLEKDDSNVMKEYFVTFR